MLCKSIKSEHLGFSAFNHKFLKLSLFFTDMEKGLVSYEKFCERFPLWNFHLLMMKNRNIAVIKKRDPELTDRIKQILDRKNRMWGDYFKSHPEYFKQFYKAYKVLHENDPTDKFLSAFA